jgi:hypothetical protein
MPNHPHPSAPDDPGQRDDGHVSLISDAGRDVVRKITSSEKAAAHERVGRRAGAAIKRARNQRRSSSGAKRSTRKSSGKAVGKRRGSRKTRARRTGKTRTGRRSSRARRR